MVRRRTKLMLGIGALAGLLIGTTGTSFAQEIDPAIAEMGVVTDTMWLLLAAFLVFFMQAGFALVEAGSTQSKNMINIMFKNLIDFCIAALVVLDDRLGHRLRRDSRRLLWNRSVLPGRCA
jgi:Amt family ammonium transporter